MNGARNSHNQLGGLKYLAQAVHTCNVGIDCTRSYHSTRVVQARKNVVKPKPLDFDFGYKQFLRCVHPDRMNRYTKQKKQNEASLQKLFSFIDEIKSEESFPVKQHLVLPFDIPQGRPGQFKTVTLNIRTSGGDCRRVIEKSILKCFNESGVVGSELTWSDKYWNPKKMPKYDDDEYEWV
eukprot:CFRG5852T1